MLTQTPINAGQSLSKFIEKNVQSGGIVSFSGNVREQSDKGKVTALFLQAYEPLTSQGIEAVKEEANAKWPLNDIYVFHRIGNIKAGETIVFVATAAKHRRIAFEAAEFLMDYLKTQAIFWKKEITETGEMWIEPREEDYKDAQRWKV